MFTSSTCSRKATVERKGLHYCTQHDPEKRWPAKEARLKAAMALDHAKVEVSRAKQRLMEAVLTNEGPLPEPLQTAVNEFHAAENSLSNLQSVVKHRGGEPS